MLDSRAESAPSPRRLPRNVWAASATSFLMDVSSEMILNVLPFFLANVLGVRTVVIGLIEGVAESTASLLKVFAGVFSDRIGSRKWPAVVGYGISALSRPLFAFATSWGGVAAARWTDRVGKGIRTAPRDALIADSIREEDRGLAFGLHRAADTGGAVLGLLIAIGTLALVQGTRGELAGDTFRTLVWVSLVPAGLAVLALAIGSRDVKTPSSSEAADASLPRARVRGLGRPFAVFLGISALFDLGNFSDAFLLLRAQERGVSVSGVLWLLVGFNLVYALVSTPAGVLSDRLGRKRLIVAGWLLYAVIYLGFALAQSSLHVALLFVTYGAYYGLTAGTAKALIADLVPAERRGAAYGGYYAVLGVIDLPASALAGLLWQGVGSWPGFGPSAPFFFGAGVALSAALLLGFFVSFAPAPPQEP